jgi:WhiB family redox-sensing transcriptional regulator
MQECRTWSLEHEETYGVWGGMTEEERENFLRGKRRKRIEHPKISEFYVESA